MFNKERWKDFVAGESLQVGYVVLITRNTARNDLNMMVVIDII